MKKYICLECSKPIRQNSKSPYIHRSCWLSLRDKNDRCYDFLFCKDKQEQKKTITIKPVEEEEDPVEVAIEEIKEIINDAKPPNYEADKSVVYQVDIAGNTINI